MRNFVFILALLSPVIALAAGPQVEIVLRETAQPLERKAAEEIAACLKRLYAADASVVTAAAGGKDAIYVNPPAPGAKLNDQAYTLKSTSIGGQPALIISGGSTAAVYWAAAEFQHQLGVRSFLFGDLDPIAPKPYSLAKWDISAQAEFLVRGWKLSLEDEAGVQGWSGDELQALIGQLAKLKYNRLVISAASWQPFVHFEAEGVKKRTGDLWRGKQLVVSGDTAGRAAFRGAKFLQNPDFAGATTYEERLAAGVKLIRRVIDSARDFGMEVVFATDVLDLPPEFAAVAADKSKQKALAKAHLRAIIETYPRLDGIFHMGLAPGPWEAIFPLLLTDPEVEKRPGGGELPINLATDVSYIDSHGMVLVVPVSGPVMAWLPHAVHSDLPDLFSTPHESLKPGFVIHASQIADHDFTANLIALQSFGKKLTPPEACSELLTPVCGEEVSGRVIKALDLAERATQLIRGNNPDFAKPAPEMVLKHLASAEHPPMWLTQAKESYLNAMNEMYRANTRSRDGGRAYTLYLARRYEFGFEYLNCVEAVKKAGVAKKNGDAAMQAAELQKAVDSMNGGLSALAAVSRSASDRATIAWLNEYGYRPLVKALEEAEDAQ